MICLLAHRSVCLCLSMHQSVHLSSSGSVLSHGVINPSVCPHACGCLVPWNHQFICLSTCLWVSCPMESSIHLSVHMPVGVLSHGVINLSVCPYACGCLVPWSPSFCPYACGSVWWSVSWSTAGFEQIRPAQWDQLDNPAPRTSYYETLDEEHIVSHSLNFVCGTVRSAVHIRIYPVSYTHLRAHETDTHLVCRLLL